MPSRPAESERHDVKRPGIKGRSGVARPLLLGALVIAWLTPTGATRVEGEAVAPRISLLHYTHEKGLTVRIQGQPGHTNVIVASDDLANWTPVFTNVMDSSLCPICPYADFSDPASTNLARRFYRCYELP